MEIEGASILAVQLYLSLIKAAIDKVAAMLYLFQFEECSYITSAQAYSDKLLLLL